MEQALERIEIVERRHVVALFIQDSLQPAKHLLEEGLLKDNEDDVAIEAENFEVRDYQLDAWSTIWEAREKGAKRALIHLATGLGKTSVGVFDVIKFREEYQGRREQGPRILFASHKNEINAQAAKRFAAFIPDATQGFFNGDDKNRDADITFATLQSLSGALATFKPSYFDYIIYDEAHHGKAATFEQVIRHFKPKFQLALTATPNRLDSLNIRELFGHELYSKGLAEALAEGLLADPDYHIVFDDAVKEAMESGFEPNSIRALTELFKVKPRNEVIAKNIREEMERIGLEFGSVKTIVFCQNIDHASEIAELLGGKPYHSALSRNQRRTTLDEFRDGDLQIITTRDMFNEGVDIPDARLLVFLRSTSSQTVFEQQLGRGLRKHAEKDSVSVLDFVANAERIVLIRDLANAIRSYRRESDEDAAYDKAGEGIEHDLGGLVIRTDHGEFDFNKLTVNLLEKYEYLLAIEDSPEDYISVPDAAKVTGLARQTILRMAQDNGWELPTYKFKHGYTSLAVSKPQLVVIKGSVVAYTPIAPEGVVSLSAFALKHKTSRTKVEKLLDVNDIEAQNYKFSGNIARGLTPKQQILLEGLAEMQLNPEGEVKSVNVYAKELGMAFTTLKNILQENGIELPDYKFGPKISGGLDSEMQKLVRELPQVVLLLDTPQAPPNVLSIKAFADSVGVDKKRIARVIKQEGIELPKYRFSSIVTGGITPQLQRRLKKLIK